MGRVRLCATIALAFSTAALAQDGTLQHYAIEATVSDNGSAIWKPQLVVEQDKAGRIEIADRPDRRYAIELKTRPLANGRLLLSTTIDVTSPSAGKLQASPVLEVTPGETATIELGEDSARTKPFRLEFKVSPVAK